MNRIFSGVVQSAAGLVLLAAATTASLAGPVICPKMTTAGGIVHQVDFDSYPDAKATAPGDVISTQYEDDGICFSLQTYNHRPTIFDPPVATASEPHALANGFDPDSGEFTGSRDSALRIDFTMPMQQVTLHIGRGIISPSTGNCSSGPDVTLTAIGQDGLGAVTTVDVATYAGSLSDAVTTPITVSAPAGGNLHYVLLDYGDFYCPEAIDAVVMVTSAVPFQTDTTPPTIQILEPLDGEILNGTVAAVQGVVTELESVPTVDVNGLAATVTAVGPGLYEFARLDVPLPGDGPVPITATVTDGAGWSSFHSITVIRQHPAIVEVQELQITQTGIVDPPATTTPFVGDTLVQGKTTLVRMVLYPWSSVPALTWVDDAELEVLSYPGGALLGTVPASSYSFMTTAGMSCAPLDCGVNFFVDGGLLEDTGTVSTERRFRLNFRVGGSLVDTHLLGPYTFLETVPFASIVLPLEVAVSPADQSIIDLGLVAMERLYPAKDGSGYFDWDLIASTGRGSEFVLSPPKPVPEDPVWEDDFLVDDAHMLRVTDWDDTTGACTFGATYDRWGLKLAHQGSHPEAIDGDFNFTPNEIDPFCPKTDTNPASIRVDHLHDWFFSAGDNERSTLNMFLITGMIGPIDSATTYADFSLNQGIDQDCGGMSWSNYGNAYVIGGLDVDCAHVLAHELTHNHGIGHARDPLTLHGVPVPPLPGCDPDPGDPGCQKWIPTARGGGYNILDRSAHPYAWSVMAGRNGSTNQSNIFLRNPVYRYLAERHHTGWYAPGGGTPIVTAPAAATATAMPPGTAVAPSATATVPGAPPAAMMAIDPLRVAGSVNLNSGTIRLNWVGPVQGSVAASPPGTSPYALELRDGSGALLLSHPLTVRQGTGTDEPGIPDPPVQKRAAFDVIVDLPPGTEEMKLVEGATILWSAIRGAVPPVVSLLEPSGGELIPAGAKMTTDWSAMDPDPGAQLFYELAYSPDGGTTFIPLGTTTVTSGDWSLARMPGTTKGQVRVRVSDGFDTGEATNLSFFELEDAAPTVSIVAPTDGRLFLQYDQVVLRAMAADPEDGALGGADVLWTSDRDGSLGSGETLLLKSLSVGVHLIEVQATDSALHAATAQIMLEMEEDTDRDGLPDSYEGTVGLDPGDPTDSAGDPDGDGLNYVAERFHRTDPLDPDTDNDGLSDGEDVRRGSDPRNQDVDGDGVPDGFDSCPLLPGKQTDSDGDGAGDLCDTCPSIDNADQADLDRDGAGDACDPDIDGDGKDNGLDCAPTDPFAWSAPGEIAQLSLDRDAPSGATTIAWTVGGSGSGAVYDVATGVILRVGISPLGSATCLVNGHPGNMLSDTADPAPGQARIFLAREQGACGTGSWGYGSDGVERQIPDCP